MNPNQSQNDNAKINGDMKRIGVLILFVIAMSVGVMLTFRYGRSIWVPMYQKIAGKRTIEVVMAKYGNAAIRRLKPHFENAGIAWPPQSVMLLAIKDQMTLELWAETDDQKTLIHTYPILAASGKAGPKLREGDRQVPEGVYAITALNPNSAYHLSMKLDYPNMFDQQQAEAGGRTNLGSNIFIHGKDRSVGCLAMGDPAIEELFALTVIVGKVHVQIAIAPTDPRQHDLAGNSTNSSPWLNELYQQLTDVFHQYR